MIKSTELTCVASIDLECWPEVWCSSQLEGKAGQIHHTVGDQEEHGHKRSNGIQLTQEQGCLNKNPGEEDSCQRFLSLAYRPREWMKYTTEESVFGQSLEYSGGSDEVRESCRQRDREHSDGDHPWQGIDVLKIVVVVEE
jgi:hypothetical protein